MNSKLPNPFSELTNDHFYGSYTNNIWPIEMNNELQKAHIVIKRICESNGLNVYNATLGGELEIYPRVNLSKVLRRQ
jgi:hypothetical protein